MIESIYIKNYKKIVDREFNFKKGINIFIGENNSGKTTILELINSFLNNDIKIFDSIKDCEMKPKIIINYKNNIWFLDTTLKTWKWSSEKSSNKHEKNFHGFLSAHPNANEINSSIKNLLINQIIENKEIVDKLDKKINSFKEELKDIIKKTTFINEDNDNYEFDFDIDWSKLVKSDFDKNNPFNIMNKGLGQQKEFIMNNYSLSSNEQNQNYLVIDEIENSLSLNSLSKIIHNFIKNENTQYFFSSHSPEILKLIKKDSSQVKVFNIGEKIPSIFLLNNKTIICEGKSDTNIFQKIWKETLFISSGGSNLPYLVEQMNEFEDDLSIKIIVDGDNAGTSYEKKISELNNPLIYVHILKKGTLEDYFLPDVIIEIVKDKTGIELDSVPKNILSHLKDKLSKNTNDEEAKKKIEKIKIKINSDHQNVDIDTIKQELDYFISK